MKLSKLVDASRFNLPRNVEKINLNIIHKFIAIPNKHKKTTFDLRIFCNQLLLLGHPNNNHLIRIITPYNSYGISSHHTSCFQLSFKLSGEFFLKITTSLRTNRER
jgi:hypothetical protein